MTSAKPLKNKAIRRPRAADVKTLDEALRCLRKCAPDVSPPAGGWVRAVREALGMTNVQVAQRLGKVPQSVEDLQKSEVAGSIKLQSLRSLGEALGCELVYALVPPKPLAQMRDEQALSVANRVVEGIHRSMRGNRKKGGSTASKRELERLIKEVLAGNPKLLWK